MQAWESHVSQLTTLLGCAPDLLREQLLYVDWSEHVAPVLLPNQWALIADAIQSTHGITFDNCWVEVLNQDTLLVCLGECWYYSKTLNCYADNDTNFFLEAELSLSKQNLGPNASITVLILKGDWHYFTCCKLKYMFSMFPKSLEQKLNELYLKSKGIS